MDMSHRDRVIDACELCGERTVLEVSHIIPKFVTDWMKKNGGTPFLTSLSNPEKREQDGDKTPMLCRKCEQKFCHWESKFANELFHPFHDGERILAYDRWLHLFVVSLAWRFGVYTNRNDERVKSAIETWRKCLLDETIKSDIYDHHAFSTLKCDDDPALPDGYNMYNFTKYDAALCLDAQESTHQEWLYMFIHIPGFVFCSCIDPIVQDNWSGTLILPKGKLDSDAPRSIPNHVEIQYKSRIDRYEGIRLSPQRMDQIRRSFIKNEEKVRQSLGYKMGLADLRLSALKKGEKGRDN
jgi:hypothetical protein